MTVTYTYLYVKANFSIIIESVLKSSKHQIRYSQKDFVGIVEHFISIIFKNETSAVIKNEM